MSELLNPPAVPMAILNFFASQPDFEAVIGDINEEFHQRVESSGARAARLWYWREAFRNAAALPVRHALRTPVRIIAVALGCVLAVNTVTASYALYSVDRLRIDLGWNQWWVLLSLQLITPLIVGLVGARLLPGREWALALTYTLVSACWAGAGMAIAKWYFSIPPASFLLHLSAPLWLLMIWGNTLRQSAFWLGCLWIRTRSRPALPQPARNPRA